MEYKDKPNKIYLEEPAIIYATSPWEPTLFLDIVSIDTIKTNNFTKRVNRYCNVHPDVEVWCDYFNRSFFLGSKKKPKNLK